jgi:putative ATP-dependent endonuclease of OLD family
MLPTKMVIHHYRALRNCTVDLSDYTALVGQNGAGKSTVLQSLRFFFEPSRVAENADVHEGFEDGVCVTVTLAELNDAEREKYEEFLAADGTLTVTKHGAPEQVPYYTVRSRTHPLLAPLRELFTEKASVFQQAYKDFVSEHPDLGLLVPRASGDQKLELRRWEREHPDELAESDMPFVFPDATKTDLIPTTRLLYVPAVHEAADDFEGTRSTLSRLIDVIVMPRIQENAEFIGLQQELEQKYRQLFYASLAQALDPLASSITRSLGQFVPGAAVTLQWEEAVPQIHAPAVRSSVAEDGPAISVDRQGHGLQRALIMALLQTYEEYGRSPAGENGETIHVCLLIEEPELYQHPPRARHFRQLLRRLATTPSPGARFRIVVTTHSPDFVSLSLLGDVRLVRRVTREGITVREISSISVAEICKTYAELAGEPLAPAEVERNLHVLEPLKEAFFATSVVLTEGPSDVGVLAAACQHEALDHESRGMVFAAMGGKGLLRQAIVIVRLLGLRAYVIFDGDTKERLPENQRLLRLLGARDEDIPRVGTPPEQVRPIYTMLQKDMETTLERDFGSAAYKQCVQETATMFGMAASRVSKNPVSMEYLVTALYGRGLSSVTLQSIVSHLRNL